MADTCPTHAHAHAHTHAHAIEAAVLALLDSLAMASPRAPRGARFLGRAPTPTHKGWRSSRHPPQPSSSQTTTFFRRSQLQSTKVPVQLHDALPFTLQRPWAHVSVVRAVWVLGKLAALADSASHATVRDLYYAAPPRLFASQESVTTTLRGWATAWGLPTWALRVGEAQSSRELVAVFGGAITVPAMGTLAHGDAPVPVAPSTLLGPLADAASPDHTLDIALAPHTPRARLIVLIVEKQSVFAVLAAAWDSWAPFQDAFVVLVTGAGYPSTGTRILIRGLARTAARICVLTDADPWGADIAISYRWGSRAAAWMNDRLDPAPPPSAVWSWIGLGVDDPEVAHVQPRLPLSPRDRAKVRALLANPIVEASAPAAWKARLAALADTDSKLELEALGPARLAAYVRSRLSSSV